MPWRSFGITEPRGPFIGLNINGCEFFKLVAPVGQFTHEMVLL
jgi:hypothetical protein